MAQDAEAQEAATDAVIEAAPAVAPVADVPTLAELFAKQEFHVAAIFGAIVVIIDALRRYDDIAFDARPNDVVFSLSPRFLATSADYLNSFVLYVLLRLLTYALPALAFLYIFSERGMTEALGFGLPEYFASFITHENFPLFWGAVVAGVLPSFSFVRDVERAVRRFAQLVGGIPGGVKRLVRLLRRAHLTPSDGFWRGALRTDRFSLVTQEDFQPGAERVAQKWARVCFILDFFAEREAKDVVHAEFYDTYRDELEREEARFRSLQIRFAVHRLGYEKVRHLFDQESLGALPRTIATHDPFLEQDVDYLLDRLETYLAAAVRYSENGDEAATAALQKVGFAMPRQSRASASPLGGLVATLGALIAATVVGAGSAYFLVQLLEQQGVLIFPYDVVPGETIAERIFNVLNYQLIIVTTVIFAGFLLGSILFRIAAGAGEARPLADRPVVKYVLASAFGAFCGLIAMTAMIVDTSRPISGAGEYAWILYWAPSLFALCLGVHLFAYGPDRGLARLIANGVIIGVVYGAAVYATSYEVFGTLGVPMSQLPGAALYYGVISFWTGLFVSTALIYIHKRQRDYRLRAEAEDDAAAAPPPSPPGAATAVNPA